MITPLTQRQILTTASLEAVRQAVDGGMQAQREAARRHALELRQAEEADEVRDVAKAEELRLEERHEGRQQGHPEDRREEEGEAAEPAEKHLDLLA
ncbi:MAG TPA: hypothetical protein VJ623_13865 [Holophagaceae bacterium]|nr:hypothetical protein [Holophagaceae bacterium]